MDGFDKHNGASKAGECCEGRDGLLAAQRDALEAFQLPYRLLDPRPQPVEPLREEAQPLLGVFPARNDGRNPTRPGRQPIGPAVIPLVGDRDARRNVRTEIEGGLELRGIAYLAAGQVKIERVAVEVGLEVDFCREAAA